ncbi:hypothetical protein [Salinarimonas rosea]|uniref:hypothetical protein n=1 Tax=Salinarimonas rosea TaxID=552063 RepID=UPI000491FBCE|nr:hypothetical protein [Salinarimonas rosea]
MSFATSFETSLDTARGVRARIDEAQRAARADETRLADAASSAEADLTQARAREARAHAALARHRLQALAEDGAAAALDRAERAALAILEERRGALEALRARVAALEAQEREAAGDRDARTAALDAAEAASDALEARVEEEIAGNAAWAEANATLASLAEQAAAARAKAERAESERADKRAPYDADPLFAYLLARGFGTSAYRGGGFARWGDGKVADLIGFEELRRDYRMLVEIPDRLRAHAERLDAEAADAEARREAIEREALVAAGIAPLEAAEETAREALEEAERVLAEIGARLAEARAEASGENDPELARALAILSDAIARDDVRRLEAEAARTPSPEDDRLVADIADARRAVVEAEERVGAAREAHAAARARATEAERALRSYEKAGYDERAGRFENGAMIGAALEGLLRGAGARLLEEALRSGYRAPPRRNSARWSVETSRGGGRSSGSFGGSSGGRRSGGFRTGGSFGGRRSGGGFRTGGKF